MHNLLRSNCLWGCCAAAIAAGPVACIRSECARAHSTVGSATPSAPTQATHRGGRGLGHHRHAAGRHARGGLGGEALWQSGRGSGGGSGTRRRRGAAARPGAAAAASSIGGGRPPCIVAQPRHAFGCGPPAGAEAAGGPGRGVRHGLRPTFADTRWVGAATKAVVICAGRRAGRGGSAAARPMLASAPQAAQRPDCGLTVAAMSAGAAPTKRSFHKGPGGWSAQSHPPSATAWLTPCLGGACLQVATAPKEHPHSPRKRTPTPGPAAAARLSLPTSRRGLSPPTHVAALHPLSSALSVRLQSLRMDRVSRGARSLLERSHWHATWVGGSRLNEHELIAGGLARGGTQEGGVLATDRCSRHGVWTGGTGECR